MSNAAGSYFEPLERWSGTLLMVAGVAWGVEAAVMLAREVGVTVPNVFIIVTALPAMLLALLGAMGFYPGLASEAHSLAVAAVGLATVALVAFIVQLLWLLAATLMAAPNPNILVLAGTLVAMGASLLLFAAGSVVATTPSRPVGVLLVAFVAVWGLWLVDFFVGLVPDALDVGFHVLSAATVLAAGYLHRRNVTHRGSGASEPQSGD